MTRRDKLLGHLRRRWISPLQALELVGILSLSQRAGELAREGHNVIKRPGKSPHTGARWTEYRVVRPGSKA